MFYYWFWWQYESVVKAYTKSSARANKAYWIEYAEFVAKNLY